jgi:hypothetical protein
MDASALGAEEGRGIAAIRAGEWLTHCDPAISEWGNPLTQVRILPSRKGTGRTETSNVARGRERIPVVVANEPGFAQTNHVPRRQPLRGWGCRASEAHLPMSTRSVSSDMKAFGKRSQRP